MTKNSNQGGPALRSCFLMAFYTFVKLGWTLLLLCFSSGARIGLPGFAKKKMAARSALSRFLALLWRQNSSHAVPCNNMYRIMYELAVCSDGMTEAQPRSFRQNRPASEYIIWHNAHSPANRCSGCSNTCTWIRKKCRLKILMQCSQHRFRLLLP